MLIYIRKIKAKKQKVISYENTIKFLNACEFSESL